MVEAAERLTLAGHVQGVGFRPFVFRLAESLGLNGYVQNRLGEVDILVVGENAALQKFRRDLTGLAPPLAKPLIARICPVEIAPFPSFEILSSSPQADAHIFVPPDYFMCGDCDRELHDPNDRRYGYAFINCTQCGPRYTLIERLPYDRSNTSMSEFPLCAACEAEYTNPGDRRFHAEPVACPACGPQLNFDEQCTSSTVTGMLPLAAALEYLRLGKIVAVKGIGGYHLLCDAGNETAIATLRRRKHRPAKPLALMFPLSGSDGLNSVRQHVVLGRAESALLMSPARPIVLAAKKRSGNLAENIAPALGEFGVLLPYSPLHQSLLEGFGAPLVATSGNISGEPVITERSEATTKLANVADAFLHHNRRIVRPADDPVYRRIAAKIRPLRMGRGCAPHELETPWHHKRPVLAVGGHMKGTIALAWNNRVVVSPHIGEMNSPRSLAVFAQVARDLQVLYGVEAERVVCDKHPGYATHRWACEQALPMESVWHHRAHASALAGEFTLSDTAVVFTWDGVGLGEDGTLWGGEALLGEPGNWRRVASLRPFRLPGGDRAGREPWRSASALLWECNKTWADCPDEGGLAKVAWANNLNCPTSSAAGRLFDAAAALVTGQTHTSFEAEGPMKLEALCHDRAFPINLPLTKGSDGIWRSDWEPLITAMTGTRLTSKARAEIFHASMANALLQQARKIRDEHEVDVVGLTGGVFQNRVLTEHAVDLLEQNSFRVLLPENLPCNDAALSYGQAVELAAREP